MTQHGKTTSKAIAVLKLFSLEEPELSPADIAGKLGMPLSTTYRVLSTLSENGLLEQNKNSGKYTIGPEMYILGRIYLQKTNLFSVNSYLILIKIKRMVG